MFNNDPIKTIKRLIGPTPLIIDPQRDATRFQNALAGLSDAKLASFYQGLNPEERRRFHYAANVCLGYDSWSLLYRNLVVTGLQERLTDRMEEAYALKAQELSRREADLEEERLALGQQIMALEVEYKGLRRENEVLREENERLATELENLYQEKDLLREQKKQMEEMVQRYRSLITDLKSTLVKDNSAPAAPN